MTDKEPKIGLQAGGCGGFTKGVCVVGGRRSLVANIRDLSSLWVAISHKWEGMMCHLRVSGCVERSLELREAPISEGRRMGVGEGGAKTHMVVTLGDPCHDRNYRSHLLVLSPPP